MRFRWKNYKGFVDTGWIKVAPITVFIGPNGSGKTTAIQPMLLMKQTIEVADESIALMAKGDHVDAGSYRDMIRNHATDEALTLSLDFETKPQNSKRSTKGGKRTVAGIGKHPPGTVELEFRQGKSQMPQLSSISIYDAIGTKMLERRLTSSGQYSLDLERAFSKSESSELVKFLKSQKPKNFLFDDMEIVRKRIELMPAASKTASDKGIQFSSTVSLYISILSYTERLFMRFIGSMKYVGPVRDTPKRVYEFKGDYHEDVGPHGEHVYSVLRSLTQNAELQKGLRRWLKEFQLCDDVTCQFLKGRSDLVEILVKPSRAKIKVNLADACFGLSQLLPLLVQAVTASKGDIIITEQPEIHLNPRCELTLADFFVEQAKTRRGNFLIETHSEHLLLRLRTHIRKGNIKPQDVKIYFVSPTEDGLGIKEIELDERGDVRPEDWPAGFFSESLSENMAFATAKREE